MTRNPPRFDIAAQVRLLGADSLLPPERPKRLRNAPKIGETDEHKAIADFFAVGLDGNAMAVHIRNEHAGAGERIRAVRMGMVSGMPDWLILDAGRAFLIELKPRGWRTKKAKRTIHELRQIEVHKQIQRAGCPVMICETLEEVIQALINWGIPLRAKLDARLPPPSWD